VYDALKKEVLPARHLLQRRRVIRRLRKTRGGRKSRSHGKRKRGQARTRVTSFHRKKTINKTLAVFPDSAWASQLHAGVQPLYWPVSGLMAQPPSPSQVLVQGTQWL
jgi:hypothetical protein